MADGIDSAIELLSRSAGAGTAQSVPKSGTATPDNIDNAISLLQRSSGAENEQKFQPPVMFHPSGEPQPQISNAGSLPSNAGMANFLANTIGLPVDTTENAINLGIAGAGRLAGALGAKPENLPKPLQNSVGGSEWFKKYMNVAANLTGMSGLSPNNPNPNNPAATAQYNFVSRGGFIPGGALPAAGSIIAESIGGPQWAQVGAMAPAALAAGVRAIPRPALSPDKALLNAEGVSMTPGQIVGGAVKRIEDAATSIPILGDAIKGAQRRGIESFNTAAINRALAPINERLPSGLVGEQALEYARGKLGDAYDSLLPNLRGDLNAASATSPSLAQTLSDIKQSGSGLPKIQKGQLARIISQEITDRFDSTGRISGEGLKNIESQLGTLAKSFRTSDNYDTRNLGLKVEAMQDALRNMVNQVNPAYQGELAKINEGYANFKRTQAAGGNIGTQKGVFTPSQLQRAVRASDNTKDKRAYSEGNALMQDLSSSGKSVLSQTVPDSGTPYRGALMYAMAHPLKASALALPVVAASLPYSSVGQPMVQRFLTSQTQQPAPNLQQLIQQAIIANQQGRQ